jgi:hypothetical protein
MNNCSFTITRTGLLSYDCTFNGETQKLMFHNKNRYYKANFEVKIPILGEAFLDLTLLWYGPEYNDWIGDTQPFPINKVLVNYCHSPDNEYDEESSTELFEPYDFTLEYKDFAKFKTDYSFRHFWNAWYVHVCANNQDVFDKPGSRVETVKLVVDKSKKSKFDKFIHNYLCVVPKEMEELPAKKWTERLKADYKAFILQEDLVGVFDYYEEREEQNNNDGSSSCSSTSIDE